MLMRCSKVAFLAESKGGYAQIELPWVCCQLREHSSHGQPEVENAIVACSSCGKIPTLTAVRHGYVGADVAASHRNICGYVATAFAAWQQQA